MRTLRRVHSEDEAAVSLHVEDAIERHVDGLVGSPTASLVEQVCGAVMQASEHREVLRYFMVESPLRAQDLQCFWRDGVVSLETLCKAADDAARLRERRIHTDRHPVWEADPTAG